MILSVRKPRLESWSGSGLVTNAEEPTIDGGQKFSSGVHELADAESDAHQQWWANTADDGDDDKTR